jgi:hypothetical protein
MPWSQSGRMQYEETNKQRLVRPRSAYELKHNKKTKCGKQNNKLTTHIHGPQNHIHKPYPAKPCQSKTSPRSPLTYLRPGFGIANKTQHMTQQAHSRLERILLDLASVDGGEGSTKVMLLVRPCVPAGAATLRATVLGFLLFILRLRQRWGSRVPDGFPDSASSGSQNPVTMGSPTGDTISGRLSPVMSDRSCRYPEGKGITLEGSS